MLKNNLQIAAIQFDIKWESKLENLKVIEEKISQITEVDIILLPEMFTTGFSMNTKNLAEKMDGPSVKWMKSHAENTNKYLVGSLIIKEKNHFFNRLVVAHPNGEIKYYDKKHLFSFAHEHENYSPGKQELILTIIL